MKTMTMLPPRIIFAILASIAIALTSTAVLAGNCVETKRGITDGNADIFTRVKNESSSTRKVTIKECPGGYSCNSIARSTLEPGEKLEKRLGQKTAYILVKINGSNACGYKVTRSTTKTIWNGHNFISGTGQAPNQVCADTSTRACNMTCEKSYNPNRNR